MDVNLVMVLIKCYNLVSKSFHRKDRSIFLALDKEIFIEAFDLGGLMSFSIDTNDLNENFKSQKSFYMCREMTKNIPMSKKEKGKIPKKKEVDKIMPFEFFQRYFQNTIFGLNKVLGLDGTMNALRGHYVIELNIQNPNTNVGYDYVTYMIDKIHEEIIVAQ